jgi:hypothetical protein
VVTLLKVHFCGKPEVTNEVIFILVIVSVVLLTTGVFVLRRLMQRRNSISNAIVKRLSVLFGQAPGERASPAPALSGNESTSLSDEEKVIAELQRLEALVEDRKQIAKSSDISYHLWEFYESHFHPRARRSANNHAPVGGWEDTRILKSNSNNGLNECRFELKGARFRFVDDEDQRGWCENIKFFSLSLYDDRDRCLIEIPIKVRVDKNGNNYSIGSGGPNAFLPGLWVNDFINTKLKHQFKRSREIREKKHRERLQEIEDLKNRFGLTD